MIVVCLCELFITLIGKERKKNMMKINLGFLSIFSNGAALFQVFECNIIDDHHWPQNEKQLLLKRRNMKTQNKMFK